MNEKPFPLFPSFIKLKFIVIPKVMIKIRMDKWELVSLFIIHAYRILLLPYSFISFFKFSLSSIPALLFENEFFCYFSTWNWYKMHNLIKKIRSEAVLLLLCCSGNGKTTESITYIVERIWIEKITINITMRYFYKRKIERVCACMNFPFFVNKKFDARTVR